MAASGPGVSSQWCRQNRAGARANTKNRANASAGALANAKNRANAEL